MSRKEEMEFLLKHLADNYKKTKSIDEKIKDDILEMSTVWNDIAVMDKFLTDLEEFELYEEDEFPYEIYIDLFLGDSLKDLTK